MTVQPKSSEPGILQRLTTFLSDDLNRVDHLIREALRSRISLTNEISAYLLSNSGKRLRPMLALLAGRVSGGTIDENCLTVAAVAELLHVASLLHDDVIDDAELRRGRPTINRRWGTDAAILAADYLYSHAFRHALNALPAPLAAHFCDATAAMCDGELFQIEKRGQLLGEEDYLFIIRCKTAELFSATARVGCAAAGGDQQAVEAMGQYALNFGYAFQITDDVLDLTADPEALGKDIGTDIASGKQTLPFIHALQHADATDRERLLEALGNDRTAPDSAAVETIRKYRSIEYARQKARDYTDAARATLDQLRDNAARQFLVDLTDLVLHRRY